MHLPGLCFADMLQACRCWHIKTPLARLQPYAKRTTNKTTKEQKRQKPIKALFSPSTGFSSFRPPCPRLGVFIAFEGF